MIHRILKHKKTKETRIVFSHSEFENKNPIKHYGHEVIVKQMILNGVSNEEITGKKPFTTSSSKIFKKAHLQWLQLKNDFRHINIPENLMQLLKNDGKAEQEKLPYSFLLPLGILNSFFFKAYHEFGYTLSQYISKGSKSVAKIIDCGDHWHCFVSTPSEHNKEKTQFHYLSSAFGIDRNDLVKRIQSSESIFKPEQWPHLTI